MTATHDYDTIVVGSGFGGSFAAYRLVCGGQRLLLLERGKPYPPGEFARTPEQMRRNLWDPSEGLHGLFDVWSFRGLEALVSSGLGGGSLIYANVLLRMPAEWFTRADAENGYRPWPVSRADLEPHYDHVERILAPQRYPIGLPPYSETRKAQALAAAARRMPGARCESPPLAVSFANPGETPWPGVPLHEAVPNLHGRPRVTCRLCGECDIGCNDGSKNTLDLTCLSAAVARGLEIRTRSEVRELRPLPGGGFEVRYVEHHERAEGHRTYTAGLRLERVTARRVVLGAGSIGSTYLLLRNRERWLEKLDPALLGTRFNGNGDLLGFVRPRAANLPRLDPSCGPVITTCVRGDHDGHAYCLQDGGIPEGANWIGQVAAMPMRPWRVLKLARRYLSGLLGFTHDSNLSAELATLFGASPLPLLGMGRETPNGRMSLHGKDLRATWSLSRTRPFYRALTAVMADAAAQMGADFDPNPLSYLRRVITVHPLGGCPMGRDEREGVVDAFGRCFAYPDLYVVDGAAMPGPVGVNPALTIAAYADRCAEKMLHTAATPEP